MTSLTLWEKNKTLIQKFQPQALQKLEAENFSDSIRLDTSGKYPSALIEREKGQFLPIHSRINPEQEATRFVDSLHLKRNHNLLLFGLGLGWHVKTILSMKTRPEWILVVEPDLKNFTAYAHTEDLSWLFRTQGLHFLLSPSEEEFFSFFSPFSFSIYSNGMLTVRHPSSRFQEDACRKLEKKIEDFKAWAKANISTQINAASQFSHNIFSNFPLLIRSKPFSMFQDSCKGLPAVVISGGPSLAKNGHLLKKIKGKALLIAVDTALHFLQNQGIEPDFIISMDFTQNALHYFDGIEFKNSVLVVDPEVYPDIPGLWKGPLSFCDLEGKSLCERLRELTGDYGVLDKGLSVAHMAFEAAKYLKADPIFLVGQDLAFSSGWSHVKGASHAVHIGEDAVEITVPGVLGPVKTSNTLNVFRHHFEDLFARYKGEIWNATEGGALIKGSQNRTLREIALSLSSSEKDIPSLVQTALMKNTNPIPAEKAVLFLENLIHELKTIEDETHGLQMFLSVMENLLMQPKLDGKALNETLRLYGEKSRNFSRFRKDLDFLRDNMYEAFILRAKKFEKDFFDLCLEPEKDQAKKYLEYQRDYYLHVRQAALCIRDQISSCLTRLKKEKDSLFKSTPLKPG